MIKYYDLASAENSGGIQKFNYTTSNEFAGFSLYISPKNSGGFMTIETKIINYDSLLDAMKAQAAKNKEICDEIIKKADSLEKELRQ